MPESSEKQGDRDLLDALASRDQNALRALFDRHGGPVVGVARGVLRDPALAEDVAQEVFLKLWRDPARFDPTRSSLRSYLLRDARGRAIDILRSETARRSREDRDHLRSSVHHPGPEQEVWESIRSQQVRSALDTLPERERSAVMLAYYGGLSYREVADHLGEAEGTVKSRIRNGLQRLQGPLLQAGLVEA